MYKKIISILLVLSMCVILAGCFTIKHQVGNGAQGSTKIDQRHMVRSLGVSTYNRS